jgi:hypothetical protein
MGEVDDDAGKKTGLGHPEKEAGDIELKGRLDEGGSGGDEAPGDEDAGEPFRGLHTTFVESYTRGILNTPESLKMELIRRNARLPNPATYLLTSEIKVPFDQTFFPIAKRMLMKQLQFNS